MQQQSKVDIRVDKSRYKISFRQIFTNNDLNQGNFDIVTLDWIWVVTQIVTTPFTVVGLTQDLIWWLYQ